MISTERYRPRLLPLIICCWVVIVPTACGRRSPQPAASVRQASSQAASARPRMSRDALKKTVRHGMTKDEVRAKLGRPSSTSESSTFDCWFYDKVYDSESQSVGTAAIYFTKQGLVDAINF